MEITRGLGGFQSRLKRQPIRMRTLIVRNVFISFIFEQKNWRTVTIKRAGLRVAVYFFFSWVGWSKILLPGRSLQKAEQLFVRFHAVQEFRSVWCSSERRIETVLKIAGNQNKNTIWAFLLYSLVLVITIFQQNYHHDQLVVTPNETTGLY